MYQNQECRTNKILNGCVVGWDSHSGGVLGVGSYLLRSWNRGGKMANEEQILEQSWMNKCWLSGFSCRTGWVRLSYQQVEMMSTRDWKTLGDIQLNRYVIFWPLERSKTQGWMRSRAAGRPIKYNFFFEWRSMIRFNVGFSWKKTGQV